MKKTILQEHSKFSNWLRRRTEDRLLMQWISYVMIFSVLLIFILDYPAENAKLDWMFYGTVLILAVLLVLNILWRQSFKQKVTKKRRTTYNWVFNLVTEGLVLAAIALTGRYEVVYLVLMQVAQFSAIYGVWPVGTVFSLFNLAAILGIFAANGQKGPALFQTGSEIFVGLIFVLVFVALVDRASHETERAEGLLRDLQAAHFELKAAQQREKELAITDERMRLARDIHDGLGHHLTVLSIQLQAADKLVERNPQAAAEAIHACRAEAQAALEEVRRSVGVMRETPVDSQPLAERLANLVHDFDEHTGLSASYLQAGQALELSVFTRQTLYRTVQEGLTNIQKHARGVKHILVKMEYEPEEVRLTIRDDGQPMETRSDPPGYGLKGLQERVNQLGGELCCGPGEAGGFEVEVVIPIGEAENDQRPAS